MISAQTRARVIAALREDPNAAAVARRSGGVKYKTVWNIAKAAGIELTAGWASRRRPQLPAAKRAQILAALKINPSPSWAARQTGVSRSTVRGIVRTARNSDRTP
jgi:lambda repressor-like predicted transcriptional regulator